MRHFYRTHLSPAATLESADVFFAEFGLRTISSAARTRTFQGVIGTPEHPSTIRLSARAEGGHYTFVEVETDQMGESRADRGVKRFFVQLRRRENPAYRLEAAY